MTTVDRLTLALGHALGRLSAVLRVMGNRLACGATGGHVPTWAGPGTAHDVCVVCGARS
jgi:hypothetical protein